MLHTLKPPRKSIVPRYLSSDQQSCPNLYQADVWCLTLPLVLSLQQISFQWPTLMLVIVFFSLLIIRCVCVCVCLSGCLQTPRWHINLLSGCPQTPRWHINLEPWASESRSLNDEAKRFLNYITTPQVSRRHHLNSHFGAWAVCLDPKYSLTHRMQSKHCRVYSFGLGVDDRSLERSLARSGCEVHCFDPSLKQPHLQQAQMWLHRLSVDWGDPKPAIVAPRPDYANTKKLATILNDFGHRRVDVLKADMESAEWKILENLVLEGVLDSVGQLLLELHLHWAGFEVGGDDPSVVRFWFSLLKELEYANFRLFHVHRDHAKPHIFLHKNVLNASSVYTLSWVNIQWKP
uniref:Methyltransferase domain-containing protein n=1 Tax=Monopterus albus TaxID=43700 RepID=A0A3Q3IJ70_MONAL